MGTEWVDGYLGAWNSHDGDQVAAFVVADVTYDDLASGDVYRGRDSIRAYVGRTHDFSTDYRFVTVSTQAEGRAYAIEWEMLGTNTGALGGFPATGKHYRIRGASIGTLDANGRIESNRDYWNVAAYLIEVGLFPLSPGPAFDTAGPGDGEPHVTSQGSVALSTDGGVLLVVNGASNDVRFGWTVGEDGVLSPLGSWCGLPTTVAGLAAT